ncbi:hypothetical protein [uncultured Pontibacter sp.]|uniref:hypothetical protein n=1 Tax=uncultured Pontibacter sp. TaxID=453356 RepID=UPI00262F41DA|nr:hypothetical protein [uncultured Pontibacter sp.]
MTEVRDSLVKVEDRLPDYERKELRNLVNEVSYTFPVTQPIHHKMKDIDEMIAGLKQSKK